MLLTVQNTTFKAANSLRESERERERERENQAVRTFIELSHIQKHTKDLFRQCAGQVLFALNNKNMNNN